MATAIQRRRGTTTQHSTFTGLAGEITIDTDKNTVVVHDGSTAGGIPLAKSSEVTALGGADITAVVAGNGLSGGSTSGDATINLDLNELTAAAVSVANDSIVLIDADDSNGSKKESIADLVSAMAGTNLTASSGTLGMADTVIRGKITVTDAGGDGSLAYNNSTGVITYTGPSASEVRAHISGGTGVTVSSGEISIGQAVATTSDVTFADVVVSGNLTVSGTQTSVNTETLTVDDNLIVLNNNESGTPSQDAGIEVERGTSTNVKLQFKESTDRWQFTNDGSTYFSLPTSTADITENTNLYYTNARADARIANAIVDEDNMASNSATQVPSQQSVKAYVDAQVATKDNSDEITEGSTNLYFTNARARGAISVSGDLSYDSGTGVISFTNDAGDIESVTAGTGLSGGGSSGAVTLAVDLSELTDMTQAVDSSEDELIILDNGSDRRKLISEIPLSAFNNDSGFTTTTGDITAVTAGNGLSGGGTSGAVSLALDLNELTAAAVDVTADSFAMIDGGDNSSKKESVADLVSAMAGTNLTASSGTLGIADSVIRGKVSATDAGGLGSFAYNSTSGAFTYTGPSNGDITGLISVTDAGGDGSLSYSSGEITYTGPSASEVRAHFSAGTGIAISSGSISTNDSEIDIHSLSGYVANEHIDHSGVTITAGAGLTGGGDITTTRTLNVVGGDGITANANDIAVDGTVVRTTGTQSVGGNKTFSNDIIISGNLTVNGTQTTVSTETLAIEDNIIVLNNGTSGTPSENAGIQVDRGSASDVFLNWDESNDKWQFTNDGSTYYNMLTETDVEGFFSVSDTGGDGSLSYSNGVFTYTGPSASEVRAHFSGGTGIALSSGTISVDLSELTDMTASVDGSADELILLDNGADRRKLMSEIDISAFNNDAGFTTNVGDITGVTAGTGLSGGGSSGGVTLNVSGLTVSELAAGSLQLSSESFSDDDTSLMTSAAINDRIESFGYTTNVGDITGVTAGTGLSGGGSSGGVTLNVSGLTVSELAADSLQTSGESFANNDTSLMTSAAIEDKILSYGYTTTTGDITSVVAGTGLTGGATSGDATLNVNTGAVSNGASTIPTGDQVYDFVIGLGYTTNVGDITGVTAGTGLSGGGSSGSVTLNVDLSELTDMTDAVDGSADELIILDNGTTKRKLVSEITLSDFNNDSGFTTNVGDITGVTAGSYLTGGGSSGSVTLNVDATSANTASKVVARDSSGNFAAGTITATATQAQYADLAEKYTADEDYEPGTVVIFGGDEEVTACEIEADHRVAGVVSTDPAYLMNSDADGVAIALKGRVPCKVTGPVVKGDLMVASSVKGHAKADNNAPGGIFIGKAIGSKDDDGEGVVEILVV